MTESSHITYLIGIFKKSKRKGLTEDEKNRVYPHLEKMITQYEKDKTDIFSSPHYLSFFIIEGYRTKILTQDQSDSLLNRGVLSPAKKIGKKEFIESIIEVAKDALTSKTISEYQKFLK